MAIASAGSLRGRRTEDLGSTDPKQSRTRFGLKLPTDCGCAPVPWKARRSSSISEDTGVRIIRGGHVREELQRIFDQYGAAREQSFAGHELANFIRGPLATEFGDAVAASYPELIWHGSAGAGNWAVGPWLAAFDPAITTSAQRGFYPVFLFSAELDVVYWSMNQGVTDLRREFPAGVARRMLGHRADRLRARLISEELGRGESGQRRRSG